MTVLWQATAAGSSRISWGTDTTYGGGTAGLIDQDPDHLFRYELAGLAPGAEYYYRVDLRDATAQGSFVAAPAENEPTAMYLHGDTRTDPATYDRVAAAMVSGYSADPALRGIALHAGDLVTDGDVAQNWDDELFGRSYLNIRRFLSEVPLQATMGNHEGNGLLFASFFPYPFVNGRYWSFDYGLLHVTVADQYTRGGIDAAQLLWMAADLAATARPWKIILLHRPGWSAGGGHENDLAVQSDIQPLAKQYGAMVVAGHNHYYARAVVDGVTHITTGGGGAPLHDPVLPSPGIVVAEKAYHYCVVEATTAGLRFRALRLDGSEIDTFTLVR